MGFELIAVESKQRSHLKEKTMAKYSKKSQESVKEAMHKFKHGELKSGGKSKNKVKNPKQAIAIGLSEARKKGAKVPKKTKP